MPEVTVYLHCETDNSNNSALGYYEYSNGFEVRHLDWKMHHNVLSDIDMGLSVFYKLYAFLNVCED